MKIVFDDFARIKEIEMPVHLIQFTYSCDTYPSKKQEGIFASSSIPPFNGEQNIPPSSEKGKELKSGMIALCMRNKDSELKQMHASIMYLLQIDGSFKRKEKCWEKTDEKVCLGWAKFMFKQDGKGSWCPVKFEWVKVGGV
jgi:hypothetical protein